MWGTAKIYFRIEYEIVTKMEKCFRKKKQKHNDSYRQVNK